MAQAWSNSWLCSCRVQQLQKSTELLCSHLQFFTLSPVLQLQQSVLRQQCYVSVL